jgi:hypothetical protein
MKSLHLIIITTFTAILLLFAGCGGNKALTGGDVKDYYPDWWKMQTNDDYVCSFGIGSAVSETAAMDEAESNAMMDAVHYLDVIVKGTMKKYTDEAGIITPYDLDMADQVVQAVTGARYSEAETGKTETVLNLTSKGQLYKTYLQFKIPKSEVNRNIYEQVRTRENLYEKLKSSRSFMELEQSFH